MGSVCCVARDATTSDGANGDILRRTIQYSPSWGVRWDNRGRVSGEETPVSVIVESVRQNNRLESKSEPFFEPLPEVVISEGNFISNPQKSPLIREDVGTQSKAHISESPDAQKITSEVEETMDTPAALDRTRPTMEPSTPSASYLSTSPLPSNSQLAPACFTPSKWSPHIPRSQLLRLGSDSQLCRLKSPTNFSASEGRSSPLLRVSSIESTRGSHNGSLDSWSVQSFPESATSTHWETWSLNNDLLGSHRHKLAQSHSQKSDSQSNELKTCVVCSKYLLEKSSFSSQKMVPNNELTVAAILFCGHVYHADCLEHLTPEISKYDPPCPVCTFGEQQATNKFEKLLKEEMDMKPKKDRSKILNSDFIPLARGSSPRLESSPRLRSSFARPFLKRHFSFSSKASSSMSEAQLPVRKRTLPWSKSSK